MLTRAALVLTLVSCASQAQVETRLELRFGEERQERQIVYGYPVETWANLETGSWTLIVKADGMVCVLAAGNGWHGQRINSTWFPAV